VDTHEAQQDTRECSPIWYLPAAPALAFDRYDGPGCHPGNHRGPAPTRHYHRSWYCQGSQRAWNLHAKRQPLVCETGAAGHHLRHSEGDRPKPQTAPPLAPWAAPKLNPGTRQSALAGCTPGSSRQWLAANGSSQTIIVSLWVQSGTAAPETIGTVLESVALAMALKPPMVSQFYDGLVGILDGVLLIGRSGVHQVDHAVAEERIQAFAEAA
jgi:hypothetical protein